MSGGARKDMAPDEAQRRASHPETSVWVSANAGSGKTHALTTRVARLLLAGTEPERILCLTFTKAAAAEMSARLYKRLGGWATMADAELAPAIADIGGKKLKGELATARSPLLHVQSTSPGGLKIQTIHAFCERLLGRFPLEADVPPQFEILDERRAQELIAEVRDAVLRRASEAPETSIGVSLAHVVSRVDELTFGKLLTEVIGQRGNFVKMRERFGGLEGICAAIRVALSVEADATSDVLLAEIAAIAEEDLRRAATVLMEGTKTDAERAAALHAFLAAPERTDAVDDYIGVFLTKEMTPRKTVITKKLGEENPQIAHALEKEQERVLAPCQPAQGRSCR